MRLLGAILAGGQSQRFGSDKALALYKNTRLLDHALAGLSRFCDQVIVVGREDGIADWPTSGRGPLAGIAGAMLYAQAHGFEHVLVVGVDAHPLPDDLLSKLSPGPAFVDDQPVVGLWPVHVIDTLQIILKGRGPYSLRALIEKTHARAVQFAHPLANINTPADLAALEKRHGL